MFGVNNKYYEALMMVLKETVNDQYDYISWWLYEATPDFLAAFDAIIKEADRND